MHFLLVNSNPAVSRLISLSVKKLGFSIDEVHSFESLPRESYDIVFVNNEQFDVEVIEAQKSSGLSRQFVYIATRGESKPECMNFMIEKPFLPTDFIDLIGAIESEIADEEELPSQDTQKNSQDAQELNEQESKEDLQEPSEDATDNFINLEDEENTATYDLDIDDLGIDDAMMAENNLENESQEESADENLAPILDTDDIEEVKKLLDEDSDTLAETDTAQESEESALEDTGVDDTQEDNVQEDTAPASDDDFGDLDFEADMEDLMQPAADDLPDAKEDIEEDTKEDTAPASDDDFGDLDFEADMEDLIQPAADDLPDAKEDIEEESKEDFEEDTKEDTAPVSDDDFETPVPEDEMQEVQNDTQEEFEQQPDTDEPQDASSSLDALSEEALLDALGSSPKENPDTKEFLRDEITQSVSDGVKEALANSSAKEALKGMRINISISFDDEDVL